MPGTCSSSSSLPWWRTATLSAAVGLGLLVYRLLRRAAVLDSLVGASKETGTQNENAGQKDQGIKFDGVVDSCATEDRQQELKKGDHVTISGLLARPELNGRCGSLVRYVPDKERWAVQMVGVGNEQWTAPVLLQPEKLQRVDLSSGNSGSSSHAFASSPLAETTWAGQQIHFFSIEEYSSAKGGDEIFNELQLFRPSVVLMESFYAGDEVVSPGDIVPYWRILPTDGLHRAMDMVSKFDFRQALAVEAVAVLAGLRLGAEIRLGDRLHVTSFDRLIERHSLDELKHTLNTAMDTIAKSMESA